MSRNAKPQLSTPDADELTRRLHQEPPHARELEFALIGRMLIDDAIIGDVGQILAGPDDFYAAAHVLLYELLVEVYNEGRGVEFVQVLDRLRDRGQLQAVGGEEALIDMANAAPDPGPARRNAEIIRDKARRRRLIDSIGRCYVHAQDPRVEVSKACDLCEHEINVVSERATGQEAVTAASVMQETWDKYHDAHAAEGLQTGYYELDEMTGGLHPGEMIVIAARPSMGKTAIALNIAEHVALEHAIPVGVFSMEMSRTQIGWRMIASRANVDNTRLTRRTLDHESVARASMCADDIAKAPLHIDDQAALSILQLRAKARRLVQRHGVELILIDYLQLMNAPGSDRDGRQNEVGAISRGIKSIARELEIPVVCLSQLNRANEQRENKRPRMSDLRESGSIEQDADVVMMLHREDYYRRQEADYNPDNEAELIINKQRNGPCGTVRLMFDGPSMTFKNLRVPIQQASMY